MTGQNLAGPGLAGRPHRAGGPAGGGRGPETDRDQVAEKELSVMAPADQNRRTHGTEEAHEPRGNFSTQHRTRT